MIKIEIPASKDYSVIIGKGLLASAGRLINGVSRAKTVAVITGTTVDALYGEKLVSSLKSAGFDCVKYVFEAGEGSKNLKTYTEIIEFLAENRLTRDDCIVALGGGTVGDIAGFAAATYLRGIPYVQIPTTLLAMVDSSVGGKTAVNLECGKNLAGAFYQPSLVIADTDTLSTLPVGFFNDGMAEVIKYGILFDGGFFDYLRENDVNSNIEYIIEKCVCFKRDTVCADEYDRGKRALLNLGHTVGHAIEKCSGYTVSHGSAVAAGTVIIAGGAYKSGLCETDITNELKEIYGRFGLPVSADFSAEELLEACLSDKKRGADCITLVLPEKIGGCRLLKADYKMLNDIIEKGLTE